MNELRQAACWRVAMRHAEVVVGRGAGRHRGAAEAAPGAGGGPRPGGGPCWAAAGTCSGSLPHLISRPRAPERLRVILDCSTLDAILMYTCVPLPCPANWLPGWCHGSSASPGQAHGIRTEAGGGGSILKGVGKWLDRGISRLIGGDGGALATVSSDEEGEPSAARHHRRATATDLSPVPILPPAVPPSPKASLCQ